MTKQQMKSKAAKGLDASVRSISSYLKECGRLLKGGKSEFLSTEQRAAFKLLRGANGLTADDCNLNFIKSYIPTDDKGRLVRFKKVDDIKAYCDKYGVDENDEQWLVKDGVVFYREIRTTWTGYQIITLLVKAADIRAKEQK